VIALPIMMTLIRMAFAVRTIATPSQEINAQKIVWLMRKTVVAHIVWMLIIMNPLMERAK
jgi:hypothetical protein